jgi:hypothetical protein
MTTLSRSWVLNFGKLGIAPTHPLIAFHGFDDFTGKLVCGRPLGAQWVHCGSYFSRMRKPGRRRRDGRFLPHQSAAIKG